MHNKETLQLSNSRSQQNNVTLIRSLQKIKLLIGQQLYLFLANTIHNYYTDYNMAVCMESFYLIIIIFSLYRASVYYVY
jgi:hypothetical protein